MIQFVANILFNFSDPNKHPFLSIHFAKTLLFIMVGVSAYWLVFRRLVSFGPNSAEYDNQQFYYGKSI